MRLHMQMGEPSRQVVPLPGSAGVNPDPWRVGQPPGLQAEIRLGPGRWLAAKPGTQHLPTTFGHLKLPSPPSHGEGQVPWFTWIGAPSLKRILGAQQPRRKWIRISNVRKPARKRPGTRKARLAKAGQLDKESRDVWAASTPPSATRHPVMPCFLALRPSAPPAWRFHDASRHAEPLKSRPGSPSEPHRQYEYQANKLPGCFGAPARPRATLSRVRCTQQRMHLPLQSAVPVNCGCRGQFLSFGPGVEAVRLC